MACSVVDLFLILCSCSFTFFVSLPVAKSSVRPKALVLPVTKDSTTLQYITQINQRTPSLPINLTLDLGGPFLWVECEHGYVSSSFTPAHCRTAPCMLARSKSCITHCYSTPKPGCSNNTCEHLTYNPISGDGTTGDIGLDIVSLHSTNGKSPGEIVSVPKFIFTCAATFVLNGLASSVKGLAGLGRTKVSLPSRFSAAFSFQRKFAICLSSSLEFNRIIIFGDGLYVFIPNIDVSMSLTYTPLVVNPVNTIGFSFRGEPSADYFIGLSSIKINGKAVKFNASLLSVDSEGNGGTKISTVNPYTVMQTSIYNAVVDAFTNEMGSIFRVAAAAPFGACFSSNNIGSTRTGPAVPPIDLVLQNESVYWRIVGSNSMVQVSDEVLCLGFVDGGENPMTSIVIGGRQLEDNLLQFDLAASKLGFSSSLLLRQTTCSNFNSTSNIAN